MLWFLLSLEKPLTKQNFEVYNDENEQVDLNLLDKVWEEAWAKEEITKKTKKHNIAIHMPKNMPL